MPIVTVVAAPHPQIDTLLRAIADDVANALGLGDGDVIAIHVPAGGWAVSGRSSGTAAWSVISIHGSHRGSEKMDAALSCVRASANEWAAREGVEQEGVWSQWLLPMPA